MFLKAEGPIEKKPVSNLSWRLLNASFWPKLTIRNFAYRKLINMELFPNSLTLNLYKFRKALKLQKIQSIGVWRKLGQAIRKSLFLEAIPEKIVEQSKEIKQNSREPEMLWPDWALTSTSTQSEVFF